MRLKQAEGKGEKKSSYIRNKKANIKEHVKSSNVQL